MTELKLCAMGSATDSPCPFPASVFAGRYALAEKILDDLWEAERTLMRGQSS